MKTTNNKLILVSLTLLFFLLAGCQTPAGRSMGEVVDDSTIGTKIKAKLFDDNTLSGFAISVEVFEGNVTLTGAVDNTTQKAKATEIANSVRGVKEVNNLLKIKSPN